MPSLFPRVWSVSAPLFDRLGFKEFRERLVSSASGVVLEVGSGTGSNFEFYSSSVQTVLAMEPDGFLVQKALAHAQELSSRQTTNEVAKAVVVRGCAEALPLPNDSVDTVLCFLVLCSVDDLDKSLDEISRVLRAGGRLLFLEHVRSTNAIMSRIQDSVSPLWQKLGGGCRCNQATGDALEHHGFEIARIDKEFLRPLGLATPVSPLVMGEAIVKGANQKRAAAE